MDVDLWAFGVLIFEMLKGNGPFCPADPDDTMAIFKLISDCRIEFTRREVNAFGVPVTSLCKELLNRSRKKRLGNLKGGVRGRRVPLARALRSRLTRGSCFAS